MESNEAGKKAREQVPLFKEKIYFLDSNLKVVNSRILDRDTTIEAYRQKEVAYLSILGNKDKELQNNSIYINAISSQLSIAKDQIKKQKVKTIFITIAEAIIAGAVIYLIK